jgi:hypothetical protein
LRKVKTAAVVVGLVAYVNWLGSCMQVDIVRQVRCVCFVVRSVLKKVDLVLAACDCLAAKFRVVCLYGNTCMLLIEPDDYDDHLSRALLLLLLLL